MGTNLQSPYTTIHFKAQKRFHVKLFSFQEFKEKKIEVT